MAYAINWGGNRRNSWIGATALTVDVVPTTQIGAELFHERSDEVGKETTSGVDLGLSQALGGHWTALGSVGPRWSGHHTGASLYLALEFHG